MGGPPDGKLRADDDPEKAPNGYYYAKATMWREAYSRLEEDVKKYEKLNVLYGESIERNHR